MTDASTEVWATALIKWAEDIESLRQREAELAAIHTEYSSLQSKHAELQQQLLPYRQQIQTLLQRRVEQTSNASSTHHSRPSSSVENNGMDVATSSRLSEAEVGLDKAKEEYHKVRQEANNEQLRGQVASSHSSSASAVALGTVSQFIFMSMMQCLPSYKEEYVNELRTQVCCLREEVETLKHDAKSRSTENQELRKQLAAVQENLQKAKESNKMLSSTMNNLHSIARGTSHNENDSPTPKKAMPSHGLLNMGAGEHSTNSRTCPTQTSTSMDGDSQSSSSPLKRVKSKSSEISTLDTARKNREHDDTTLVNENLNPQLYPTVIPPTRRSALSSFLNITINVDISSKKNCFSRDLLASTLGGSIQPLIVRLSDSQTALARSLNISGYLCPGMELNPWCPSAPGQHGYLFVGLGREKETFIVPEVLNIFGGSKNTLMKKCDYMYLGFYKVTRVDPLSVKEWDEIPEGIKMTYAKVTQEKTEKQRTAPQVLSAYKTGDISVPCVRLECIGFNTELYNALLVANSPNCDVAQAKRIRCPDNGPDEIGRQKRRSSRR
ncbi:hypothetical protein BDQ12DRAFT_733378 [Crucibulum laeve]|uniref:DUF6697 domain-containing protein n=1 Tax=Crucibulum laeve TaxID=68775 RepID=A0A5C3M6L5_9AGAR|nr:hypothetical protein BDQ12DRAFT_733378 [Crucibulum laeve]